MNKCNSFLVILMALMVTTSFSQKVDYSSEQLVELGDQIVIDFAAIDESTAIVLKEHKLTKNVLLQRIGNNNSSDLKLNYSKSSRLYVGENSSVYLATSDTAFKIESNENELKLVGGHSIAKFWTDIAARRLQRQQALSGLHLTDENYLRLASTRENELDSVRIEEDYFGVEYKRKSFSYANQSPQSNSAQRNNMMMGPPQESIEPLTDAQIAAQRARYNAQVNAELANNRPMKRQDSGRKTSAALTAKERRLIPLCVQNKEEIVIIDGDKKKHCNSQ